MPDPTQDPQSGGGGESTPQPGNEQETTSSEATPQGGEDSGKVDEKFVTREVLQGSQNALRRFLQEDLKKSTGSLKDELANLVKSTLDERLTPSTPDSKGKGDGKDEKGVDPETAKVLREHQDAVRELNELKAKLNESQTRERDFRFKTRVMDALQKLGCKKPEFAFRVVARDLSLDEENPERVYATIKGEWGDEELELEDFLTRVVRDEMIPELFDGVTKPGSPAGGDAGGTHYLYTKEQISDPQFYLENKDKIRTALEKGLVKGVSKPGG